jgi:hypothetical protein
VGRREPAFDGRPASAGDHRRRAHRRLPPDPPDLNPEPYLLEHPACPARVSNLELLEAAATSSTLLPSELTTRQDGLAARRSGRLAAAGETALVHLGGWRGPRGGPRRRGDSPPAIGDASSATGRPVSQLAARCSDAAAAGLCEPPAARCRCREAAVEAVDAITASLRDEPRPRAPEVRVLRQALGYCWSVAIGRRPNEAAFERPATPMTQTP